MRALLRLELKANSNYVDIAIADAIRHVRAEKFWFNVHSYTLTTVDDVYQYTLPADFLGIRGKVYCTPENSSSSGRFKLQPCTADEIEEILYDGSDYGSWESTGVAKRYAIDHGNKTFIIAPRPSTGGDTIYFKYTQDLGTPIYTVSAVSSAPPSLGATVTLLGPDGQTLPTSYTNAWFQEGFKLIKERALYELFSRFHSGTEESSGMAQTALMRFLEELNRMRGETAQQQAPIKVRKHL